MRRSIVLKFVLAAALCCLPHSPLLAQKLAPGDVITSQTSGPTTRFTLITEDGYVSFAVPNEWEVISMQSRLPVAAAAFHIPEPKGTKKTAGPSNVSVSLIQRGSDAGQKALSRIGKSYEGEVRAFAQSGWDCFSQVAHQGSVPYTILDARRTIANLVVFVRFAWPEQQKDASQTDEKLRFAFAELLSSVGGAKGIYQAKPGDVVRHPEE